MILLLVYQKIEDDIFKKTAAVASSKKEGTVDNYKETATVASNKKEGDS